MRPRFSLRQLLAFVVFVALGFGGLMASWPWMASVIFTLSAGILGFAVLAAIGKTGRPRFYWIGFAVVGCGYLWLAGPNESGMVNQANDGLVTNRLLWGLWDLRYPGSELSQMHQQGGMGGGMFTVPAATSIAPVQPNGGDELRLVVPQSNPASVVPVPPTIILPGTNYDALAPGFFRIGQAMFALFFAYLGGCLTRAFYDGRSEQPAAG